MRGVRDARVAVIYSHEYIGKYKKAIICLDELRVIVIDGVELI